MDCEASLRIEMSKSMIALVRQLNKRDTKAKALHPEKLGYRKRTLLNV